MSAPPWSHLLLFVLALTALPASAASLGETVTAALTQGGQQQRVAALRGERDAVRDQAGSLIAADPALRLKGLSDRMTENDGAYELEAMVDMPMWMPGQRSARIAVAESLGMRADALQRLLRWEAAGQVREAAWEATLAHGQLRQAAAALQAAKSLEATVAKRTDAGELARMELLTARQETAARGVDMAAAQLGYDQAIAAFVLLTGQPRLPEPLTEAVPDALAAGDIGMTLPPEHPLLASADGALAQARAERERASAERRGHPLLSLGGKRARDDRTVNPVDAVQLEVSIPFGLKRQAAPMLAGAEREVHRSDDRIAPHSPRGRTRPEGRGLGPPRCRRCPGAGTGARPTGGRCTLHHAARVRSRRGRPGRTAARRRACPRCKPRPGTAQS